MNYKEATKILMRNLKGSKNKQVSTLELAEAMQEIRNKMPTKEMEKFFDISHTMISRINKINGLEDDTKKIIQKANLGIEKSYLLTKLSGNRQIEAAKEIVSLNAHNSRQLINLLIKKPKDTVKQLRNYFEKNYMKKFSLLIIPMSDDLYSLLLKKATKAKKTPHDLAFQVLEDYLIE